LARRTPARVRGLQEGRGSVSESLCVTANDDITEADNPFRDLVIRDAKYKHDDRITPEEREYLRSDQVCERWLDTLTHLRREMQAQFSERRAAAEAFQEECRARSRGQAGLVCLQTRLRRVEVAGRSLPRDDRRPRRRGEADHQEASRFFGDRAVQAPVVRDASGSPPRTRGQGRRRAGARHRGNPPAATSQGG
jgi:hypothetical protein